MTSIQFFDNFECYYVSLLCLLLFVLVVVVVVVTRKADFLDHEDNRGSKQHDKRAHKDVAGALAEPTAADCRGCEDHDDGERDGLAVKGERLVGVD